MEYYKQLLLSYSLKNASGLTSTKQPYTLSAGKEVLIMLLNFILIQVLWIHPKHLNLIGTILKLEMPITFLDSEIGITQSYWSVEVINF